MCRSRNCAVACSISVLGARHRGGSICRSLWGGWSARLRACGRRSSGLPSQRRAPCRAATVSERLISQPPGVSLLNAHTRFARGGRGVRPYTLLKSEYVSINFQVNQVCGRGRVGQLATPHAVIDTPVFMPVGTVASVKGVPQDIV